MKTPSSKPGCKSQKADPDPETPVGYGNPPKRSRFKPGQSGNPRGRPRTTTIGAKDFKNLIDKALARKVTLKDGERVRTLTLAQAGIEQLARQFAKGDARARRDLLMYADKLGLKLAPDADQLLAPALSPDHEAILENYMQRRLGAPEVPRREYVSSELFEDAETEAERAPTVQTPESE